ncbi:MAG: hypothetical protein AB2A00_43250, partial [Myxococcota bacterium]
MTTSAVAFLLLAVSSHVVEGAKEHPHTPIPPADVRYVPAPIPDPLIRGLVPSLVGGVAVAVLGDQPAAWSLAGPRLAERLARRLRREIPAGVRVLEGIQPNEIEAARNAGDAVRVVLLRMARPDSGEVKLTIHDATGAVRATVASAPLLRAFHKDDPALTQAETNASFDDVAFTLAERPLGMQDWRRVGAMAYLGAESVVVGADGKVVEVEDMERLNVLPDLTEQYVNVARNEKIIRYTAFVPVISWAIFPVLGLAVGAVLAVALGLAAGFSG